MVTAVGYMIGVCVLFALIALLCWLTEEMEK